LLGDSEELAGTLESFAVFVTLGIANDLAFERFDSCRRSTSSRMILTALGLSSISIGTSLLISSLSQNKAGAVGN
jgi:hypothetical protein